MAIQFYIKTYELQEGLKKSLHLITTIHGFGSVRENTWYPAWYLRNPWIGYMVVPILVSLLAFQVYRFIYSTYKKGDQF